jgi:hypothetical protein
MHRALWKEAFSLRYALKRTFRALFRLRFGAFVMCAAMNLFYCLKNLRGNTPVSFEGTRLWAGVGAGPEESAVRAGGDPRSPPDAPLVRR